MGAFRIFKKFKALLDVDWENIADGQYLKRNGTNIDGGTPEGGSGGGGVSLPVSDDTYLVIGETGKKAKISTKKTLLNSTLIAPNTDEAYVGLMAIERSFYDEGSAIPLNTGDVFNILTARRRYIIHGWEAEVEAHGDRSVVLELLRNGVAVGALELDFSGLYGAIDPAAASWWAEGSEMQVRVKESGEAVGGSAANGPALGPCKITIYYSIQPLDD